MNYVILIPLLPLLAFGAVILFGKRLPGKGSYVSIAAISISFILSVITFIIIASSGAKPEFAFNWFNAGNTVLQIGFIIDGLSAVMLIVVSTVSLLIQIYSIGYMHGDIRYSRYYAYLSLFTFSMLGLVLSNNFLQIFIFWELVGVCSYFLIGFWFEKKSAADAGKKAFITTKIGDFGFYIGILLLFAITGSLNFKEIGTELASGQISTTLITLSGILIFCGAVGKSAQFPLHVWLPDAMEGPTPVSALIHAATMVAAGVYLVARCYFLFSLSSAALTVVAYIGIITAFMAATIALVNNDIKRVLAYSTLSQLGYMMVGLGVGGYTAGMFHLTTHAFFKALLFLCAGSVIHGALTQDIREMGGLFKNMKITAITFLIAALSISGIWPFSGFYSKDEILLAAYHSDKFIYVVATIVAGLTSFYMFRLFFVAFMGESRSPEKHAHESPYVMTIPLMVLAFLSIVSGKLLTIAGFFSKLVYFEGFEHIEESHIVIISLAVAVSGILLAWLMYSKKIISAERIAYTFKPVYTVLYNKYYFDEFYMAYVVRPIIRLTERLAKFDLKFIDGGVNYSAWLTVFISRMKNMFDILVVDGAVNGVAWIIRKAGNTLKLVQTGFVQNYMLIIVIALSLMLLLKLWR